MEWFLACLGRAIDGAQTTLSAVLQKARFWQKLRDVPLNGRQRVVLNRLLDGFEGKLTTIQLMLGHADTGRRNATEPLATSESGAPRALVKRGGLTRRGRCR
jgi:Fic family protein